ncbi:MAG: transcriptional repressor [Oscillospiraceae bacterium]|nr:transcriptional repressor [Oscillospiraceae bacterium]
MVEIASELKKNKLKLTPQRLAIYRFLKETKSHPSADDIYKAIFKSFPSISLATVYKTLKTLVDVELISEINVGEGSFRYECNIGEPHSHFYCNKCNKVEDIELKTLTSIKEDLEKSTNNKIDSLKIYLFGTCKNCLDKNK